MPTKKQTLQTRLADLLESNTPPVITTAIATQLRASLGAPVSDNMWKDLLRSCNVPLAPLLEGVRQETLASLERTLLALWQEYHAGDPDTRRRCRALVIEAKDHARLAARNPKVDDAKRALKEEMVLWMLTWLENPEAFALWVPLRKHRLATAGPQTPPG